MIVSVDIIPFRLSGCADKGLEVLLIKRSNPNRHTMESGHYRADLSLIKT